MLLPKADSGFAPPTLSTSSDAGQDGAVLLFEDEPSIAHMLIRVFAQVGLKVIWARDLAEGLSCFEENHRAIALALVDCRGSGFQGREFCRRVRTVAPGVPVLFAGSRDPDATGADGPTDFIAKPYLPTELAWRVRSLLRRPGA